VVKSGKISHSEFYEWNKRQAVINR
jgi:hypothetical protein